MIEELSPTNSGKADKPLPAAVGRKPSPVRCRAGGSQPTFVKPPEFLVPAVELDCGYGAHGVLAARVIVPCWHTTFTSI